MPEFDPALRYNDRIVNLLETVRGRTQQAGPDRKFLSGPALLLLLYLSTEGPALNRFPRQRMDRYSANTLSSRSAAL